MQRGGFILRKTNPFALRRKARVSFDLLLLRAILMAAPGTGAGGRRCRRMRIKEENRNMVLLATVTLCCGAVAGMSTLLDPVLEPAPERLVVERGAVDAPRTPVQTPVRVVGAPFEPNVNPRER